MLFDATNVQSLLPAASSKNYPILFCCEVGYLPHALVVIQSILRTGAKDGMYDFLILHTNISEDVLAKVAEWEIPSNASIRFINAASFDALKNQSLYIGKLALETYYRILAPQILPNYDSVLYVDCDVVVRQDISEIFSTPLGDSILGACHDRVIQDECITEPDTPRSKYIRQVLGVPPDQYFNAGIILLNLEKMRQIDFLTQFLEKAKQVGEPLLVDQDILNSLCLGKVRFLDQKWNVSAWIADERELYPFLTLRSDDFKQWAKQVRKDIGIIHYTGVKPWDFEFQDYVPQFYWENAQGTPFYSSILQKRERQVGNGLLLLKYISSIFQLFRCSVLGLFHSGDKRFTYRMRKSQYILKKNCYFNHIKRRFLPSDS